MTSRSTARIRSAPSSCTPDRAIRWSSRSSGMGNSRPSTSPSAGRADAAPALRRRDASLYILASGLGGLGLGIALFYLNFLYRALGFDARAIGVLGGAQALGALAGAVPAALLPRRMPRRNAIFAGGCRTPPRGVRDLTPTPPPPPFVPGGPRRRRGGA